MDRRRSHPTTRRSCARGVATWRRTYQSERDRQLDEHVDFAEPAIEVAGTHADAEHGDRRERAYDEAALRAVGHVAAVDAEPAPAKLGARGHPPAVAVERVAVDAGEHVARRRQVHEAE